MEIQPVPLDDTWWETPAAVADTYTPEQGDRAWAETVHLLGDLLEATRALGRCVLDGTRSRLEALDAVAAVVAATTLQDIRRDLGQIESLIARQVGHDEMAQREGTLPDGRIYKVQRGATRKAWDHDGWQGQVREQVCSGLLDVVYDEDGTEVGSLRELIAAAQRVHGSTAPKVTALRQFGLSPDEFCETYPGPYSLRVSAPGEDTPDE